MYAHSPEWHEWRRQGIGGSDVADVLNLEPYGCARRLWYVKRGTEPDLPEPHNPHMERGRQLEGTIRRIYKEHTPGAFVRDDIFDGFTHREHSWMRGNVDGIITIDGVEGVLECKAPARHTFFQIKSNGLPDSWLLQMQHYLAVTGFTWGAFAILWAEGWEFLTQEVKRDDTLIASMVEAELAFWQKVENAHTPDQLPPDDSRCAKCRWVITCMGVSALMEYVPAAGPSDGSEIEDCTHDVALSAALRAYIEVKSVADESKEMLDAQKEILLKAMGERSRIRTGDGRASYNPTTRRLTVTAYGG